MRHIPNITIIISLLTVLLGCGGENRVEVPDQIEWQLDWTPIDSLNERLPVGIEVFHAELTDPNLRAWYVQADILDSTLNADVLVSTDQDRLETVTEFARRTGAPVVVNGGYFRMDLNPAKHVGVLQVDGELIEAPTPSVLRDDVRFYTHRAAIGIDESDSVTIGWISSSADTLLNWQVPLPNAEGLPGERPPRRFARPWMSEDIVGGGPLLIRDGRIDVAWESEVFFGTSIPEVHPRTAAGITAEGDLILLVVDGRQSASRGVDLYELAHILKNLGCVEALNLDGGGSSTLIVDGVLLNRPAGGMDLRPVMSAIAIR